MNPVLLSTQSREHSWVRQDACLAMGEAEAEWVQHFLL